jgi:hypothetical protein
MQNNYCSKALPSWLFVLLLWLPATLPAGDGISDDYLKGYLSSVLEREFDWPRGSYQLQVHDGLATIELSEDDTVRRNQVETGLSGIEGLQGVNILVADQKPVAEQPTTARRQLYSFLGVTPDTIPFPNGDLFLPLLADPKQPQFFVSYRRYDTSVDTINMGAVGFGETFGLYRREGKRPGDGLQVSISGGLFAQFNLDAPSHDLINADYTIGLPVTYRHGPLSARLRLYHQSSHLGDEYLLRAQPERINLSFESLEMLFSYEWQGLRAYGGGEYLLRRDPGDLERASLHGGFEYRRGQPTLFGGRLVGGLDLKSWQEHDWSADASLKLGLEFGANEPGRRRLRIMAEAYDGYAPHGQFYDDEISYYGLGLYLGF